ncbi:Oxygen-independent coproporphyrinogen III oxidase [Vibrio stylophorae]|uniref:Coproporphyrinogen-III oxidase n=1 Tax=Vibrio stylophorae TaxID=659351 RepID=A0ABM8ZPZ4_9VIBR|nr:oxygen-independent coproporphyrinogen III oxidase [Vibrio stylophorae]CAH0532318.1 Oxygen-independent coproporphyrinogen III oxidase [Vibrio stylophorae]
MSMSSLVWDQALIEKYNYSGPRYTSYPTAVEFHEGFGHDEFIKACQAAPQRPLSLYVHIPFCHTLCYYCGCNKVITRHQNKADIYLDYLEREIAERAQWVGQRRVTQLHFGGGTPTFLDDAQFTRLMTMIRAHFTLTDDAEVSLELDPREFGVERLDTLKQLGINRLSIGVQDFDKEVQRVVNRVQDEAHICALVHRARELGFGSLNLDLIYGLPKQTQDGFQHTLDQVLTLRPDRLSVFNYAHMPQLFAAQRKLKDEDMPAPKTKLAMLGQTISTLTQAGYQFIGMDHFALPEDELAKAQRAGELHRNFQGYTTQGECDLLGFGVSAISMMGDSYSQNAKVLKEYYAALDAQGEALWRGVELNQDDLIRREVIKTLICNFQLNKANIEAQFAIDFDTYFAEDMALLKPFIADQLVTLSADKIEVSVQGRLLIRNICMCFDTYLRDRARQQQFSRVI